jgi:hypothetical protein
LVFVFISGSFVAGLFGSLSLPQLFEPGELKTLECSEDEANSPTGLNSKFAYLQAVMDSVDTAPTDAEGAVFADLDGAAGAGARKMA